MLCISTILERSKDMYGTYAHREYSSFSITKLGCELFGQSARKKWFNKRRQGRPCYGGNGQNGRPMTFTTVLSTYINWKLKWNRHDNNVWDRFGCPKWFPRFWKYKSTKPHHIISDICIIHWSIDRSIDPPWPWFIRHRPQLPPLLLRCRCHRIASENLFNEVLPLLRRFCFGTMEIIIPR